ncbi:PilZ domain-containing protein [Atopomonas sediminilitoris]|uniref:PilZ domain-containing protein n=1 Tax=Atopomonas sediminilitoris TaxID=2919919 RepID=UPI001F4E4203|nr:PilZ domain-containing protein [Atopomonas sediminilitoris]MCJ8168683.1 PilZ domain-containing protein [Atopomonas sediminilitoris]
MSREQRHIQRQQLPYYLKVFNRITDKPMGYLGNVSSDGLMLISQLPLLTGVEYQLRLKLPGCNGKLCTLDLQAHCHWSREEATPGYYDSGFSVAKAPAEFAQLEGLLRSYFSFRGLPESA